MAAATLTDQQWDELDEFRASTRDARVFRNATIILIIRCGRYLDDKYMKADVFVTRTEYFGDGAKAAIVEYRDRQADLQRVVFIQRDFAGEDRMGKAARPMPIEVFYFLRTPLQEALPKATVLGAERVNGRDCYAFFYPQADYTLTKQDLVYCLDATMGTPIKITSYLNEATRTKGSPAWTWTCDKLETTQGHEIPAVSTMETYGPDGKSMITHNFTVESIKFDADYPATTFWPTIQTGVTVLDSLAKKTYETPGVKLPDPPVAKVATEAIVATPPGDGSATTSRMTLGLGFAMLLAGGIL